MREIKFRGKSLQHCYSSRKGDCCECKYGEACSTDLGMHYYCDRPDGEVCINEVKE